jgi:cytidine deaminase
MKRPTLIAAARAMRRKAYAPYSNYAVGAALLGEDGRIYVGCNVENGSYGLTVCAERAAIFQAVAAGCRAFEALAIATEDQAPPCGACLQVAREFGPTLRIVLAGATGEARETTLAELLPSPFVPRRLQKKPATARRRRSRPATGHGTS